MMLTKKLSFVLIFIFLSCAAYPSGPYVVSTDGTEVTDTQTGLIWRHCSEGQLWNGSTCSGIASLFTHEQALIYAQSQINWRLPNVKELSSIIDRHYFNPAIDSVTFPATAINYWSSTPYIDIPDYSWYVTFYSGYSYAYIRTQANAVRLVR